MVKIDQCNINVVDEYHTTNYWIFCNTRNVTTILQTIYASKPRSLCKILVSGQGCNDIYCSKFLDRDFNASLNILAVHTAAAGVMNFNRPNHLSRENVEALNRPGRFELIRAGLD